MYANWDLRDRDFRCCPLQTNRDGLGTVGNCSAPQTAPAITPLSVFLRVSFRQGHAFRMEIFVYSKKTNRRLRFDSRRLSEKSQIRRAVRAPLSPAEQYPN